LKENKVDIAITKDEIGGNGTGINSNKNNIFSRPTSHAFVKRGGSNMLGNNIIKNRASPDISKGIGNNNRINKSNYNSE